MIRAEQGEKGKRLAYGILSRKKADASWGGRESFGEVRIDDT